MAAKASANLPKAPTREVLGLTIGQSDDAAIQAWLQERGLSCTIGPAPRRQAVRYDCSSQVPTSLLPDRVIKGKVESLGLARTDAGPLHNLSTRRIYSIPADAVEDYNSARAAITAVLGQPTRGKEAGEIDPSKPLAWYSTMWRFEDLSVTLGLLRAVGSTYTVSERWQVPGVDEELPDREGVRPIHGAPSGPRVSNPHALPSAAPTTPSTAPAGATGP